MKMNLYLSLLLFLFMHNVLNAQYCSSNATNSGHSKIDNVRLVGETVTINQNSAGPCETYTDYTNLPAADLIVGGSYSVEVTLGTCNGDRDKSATVYIDFNGDNDFDDVGETLGNTGNSLTTSTLTINFTVDNCPTVPLGSTRMRVVLKQGTGAINSCGTYTRGETEDYTVRLIAPVFYLVGNATATAGGCTQLTAASNGELGMAWDVVNPLDFAAAFSYDFTVNLGSNDGGADGIMFIIQNDPLLQCVTPTGGWGAGNISNSLCIEIDTYLNTEDRDDGLAGVLCSGGPDPDHLDIWLNGNVNPSGICGSSPGARIIPAAIPLLDGGVAYNAENGLDHIFRVAWTPGAPGTITASLLNAAGTVVYATVSHSFDPLTVFGTTTPMYGFSGSTGGLNNAQSFCPSAILLNNNIVEFDAKLNTNDVTDLSWTAMNDNNNDYFVIEKGYNSGFFDPMLRVESQTVTNQVNYYEAVDPNPFIGVTYYRLKQVKVDGAILYSNVKAIERKEKEHYINVYPNPATDDVTITVRQGEKAKITLNNQLGQSLTVPQMIVGNKVVLDLSGIGAGVYLLQIKTNSYSNKVVKLVKRE